VEVLPTLADCALAPISSSSCGICSIINNWAIDSIANPYLNNDLGTIIAFLGETFGLAASTGSRTAHFIKREEADFWRDGCIVFIDNDIT
jgi:hypothetical protein